MDVSTRFNSKFVKNSSTNCWEWQGYLYNGYGALKVSGKQIPAHRLSWALFRGDIPSGIWVLHKCDNRKCVNPEHLFLGTAQDNALDREKKGRGRCSQGELSGSNKLTEEEVKKILSSEESSRKLAPIFGVSDRMIRYIKSKFSWRYL